MRAIARRLSLLMLLAFEVAAVVVVHRLGRLDWLQIDWSDLGMWLSTAVPEDALAAVLRLITLAIAYWMLTTTLLYLLARLTHLSAALRAVEWATIPSVRRAVDGAVAVTIATASIAGPVAPALASTPTPVVIQVDEEGRPVPPGQSSTETSAPAAEDRTEPGEAAGIVPPGLERIGWTPSPAGTVAPQPGAITNAVNAATNVVGFQPEAPRSVVVEPGDHLWLIAERQLEEVAGVGADDVAVGRYWRRVIEANRHRLRSGDPDLIYPGETILLPPITVEDQ